MTTQNAKFALINQECRPRDVGISEFVREATMSAIKDQGAFMARFEAFECRTTVRS